MRQFRYFAGLFLILFGVVFGLYAGLWWAFIGGWVDIVTGIVNGLGGLGVDGVIIGFGILKVILSGAIGWFSVFICFVFGIKLMSKK